jgi:hypothetical protein
MAFNRRLSRETDFKDRLKQWSVWIHTGIGQRSSLAREKIIMRILRLQRENCNRVPS